MCEACFRVSLKHASLCSEIFKKVRLKVLLLGPRGHLVFSWAEFDTSNINFMIIS